MLSSFKRIPRTFLRSFATSKPTTFYVTQSALYLA